MSASRGVELRLFAWLLAPEVYPPEPLLRMACELEAVCTGVYCAEEQYPTDLSCGKWSKDPERVPNPRLMLGKFPQLDSRLVLVLTQGDMRACAFLSGESGTSTEWRQGLSAPPVSQMSPWISDICTSFTLASRFSFRCLDSARSR
jgi:hypothetical protein